MTITLIRHTSVDVAPGICYGQSDVDVSSTFEEEALRVSLKLQNVSFDAVYCSPLVRCRKLASYCGFPNPVLDDRLMELNFGIWEMKPWTANKDPQLQRWFDNWIDEIPTSGESFRAMTNRVENFLKEIKKLNHQQVALFTHAGVIRALGVINHDFTISHAFDNNIQYGDVIHINVK